jgi:hypothetical protein
MALTHYDVTLTAVATPITTNALKKNVAQAIIHNTAQNSSVYIGNSDVSATSWGFTLGSSEEVTIGPFSGSTPLNTSEIYLFGTENDIVHVLVVTY